MWRLSLPTRRYKSSKGICHGTTESLPLSESQIPAVQKLVKSSSNLLKTIPQFKTGLLSPIVHPLDSLPSNGKTLSRENLAVSTTSSASFTIFLQSKKMLDAWDQLKLVLDVPSLLEKSKRVANRPPLGMPPSKRPCLLSPTERKNSVNIYRHDEAVRGEVAGGPRILLIDRGHISYIYSAIVLPDRIESEFGKRAYNSNGGKSQTDICRRFNSTARCPNLALACYYRHVRSKCKKSGHSKQDCDSAEGKNSQNCRLDWIRTSFTYPLKKEIKNPIASKTISENPSLFKITTPIIHADRFEYLLKDHPNQPFVSSVCRGLREGFWPFADTLKKDYPITHDASLPTPKDITEASFLRSQRAIEEQKGRFSAPFGKDLLPGIYSMPIHAVPKPGSTDLRMVTDQSAGKFSLNSMIAQDDIKGYPLDTLKHLREELLCCRRSFGDETLMLFKSDVAEAYRLMPVHPFLANKTN